jgi:hypothetical protein
MILTVNIPDDIFEDVKDKLATQPTGVLETIALDAVLHFLQTLREYDSSKGNGAMRSPPTVGSMSETEMLCP